MFLELGVCIVVVYLGVVSFKFLREYVRYHKLAASLPTLDSKLPILGDLISLWKTPGNKWQTRRKILTPAFHFSILKQFISIFNDETTSLLSHLDKIVAKDNIVDIVPLITDLTLLTINETSMGVKLDLNTKEGYRYKQDIYEIGDACFQRFIRPWLYLDLIYYYCTASGKYFRKITDSLHRFTEKVINEREKDFKRFEVPVNENDDYSYSKNKKMAFLDLLINAKLSSGVVDNMGIREEVNTFMFEIGWKSMKNYFLFIKGAIKVGLRMSATKMRLQKIYVSKVETGCSVYFKRSTLKKVQGHDTTAMNISYTLMLMANNPSEQEKVYQELVQVLGHDLNVHPNYNQLQELHYTERCIKESLRLYPSVPYIGRTAGEEISTDYGIIPKCAPLHLMIYDMQRHPKVWPNPEKFDPDRFLVENSIGRHPYAFLPFSAGPRNCIGQRFAVLEAKAVLAGIIRKFKLETVDTHESLLLIQDLVLRPKNGIKVKFVPRESQQ